MNLERFDALSEGQVARLGRVFSPKDLREWRELCQLDQEWTGVPEPLIAGLFSCLLGEDLPGHGTNYLKQTMTFHAIAEPDEPLQASVTVSRLRRDKALVNLATVCTGRDGRLICDGEALVLFQH
ncbi:hypothetical protein ACFOZ5_17580 [Marinobacter lacisalsi]|uniref:Uncharacterized protein n=1 Tax=Marinobacter lacisalsi TaxID=475979 RepID=A0ABV8QKG6_9GAMM